jgi:hypothetical protein
MVTTAHQKASGIDLKWDNSESASAKYTALENNTTPDGWSASPPTASPCYTLDIFVCGTVGTRRQGFTSGIHRQAYIDVQKGGKNEKEEKTTMKSGRYIRRSNLKYAASQYEFFRRGWRRG